ncbi:SpaA isopeptide-forming pilin-related protein [Leuconostoc pseudomesenteroides]|uniref:SpaA isopeptide-forming pilin-related protein n=1 Tax=Leuconostoc pseudomesenteroides TaxID=33968 RepID=UPI00403D957E
MDPIPDGQVYVDDSAKLYEATVNTDGSYKLGSEVTDANIALNSDKTKITASLPEGSNKVYVLIFDTSLDGTVINQSPYTNTATYSNDSNTSNLDAQVSVPNSGSLVTKNGQQDTSDSAYAKYSMWVNKSQSTLKNVVVDDTPSDNQIIDEQSIVINETTVDKNGNFTENTSAPLTLNKDYKVELTTDPSTGKQELKISFINQISKAYVINYRSLINSSKSNDTLNNSVTITGDNEKSYTETKTTNTNVVNNGGSANGKNLNLVISKTDADTKKALPGATFELYSDVNGQKGQLLRSGTTSSDGQLAWNNLKSGKYILVETSAPDGYNIASDYAQGKEISLTYSDSAVDANNNFTLNVANEEKTGSVVLTKTDSDTNKILAGATFSLYKSDGTKVASDLTTDAKGQISKDGLKPGDYYFVETAAPAGYDLNKDKQYKFTIAFQDIESAGKVVKVSATNGEKTGSVVLTKTDSDTNKVLAGATFDLYKADGTKVATGLTTKADGQINKDGLKPGEYYFVETAAPDGYSFDKDKHYDFTVELQTTAKVATVSATNAQKTGSVVLTKKDSDTGKVLAGAKFDLYKADGTEVAKDLTTKADGQINQDDLKPGDYYFVETAAPAGYNFDKDKHYDFTVELQTTAKVVTVSATNEEKTGSVVLTKTDSDTNKVLAGATFDLYKADGTEVATDLTTDAKGEINQDDLKPGDYYFVETAAPAGYNFDKDKHYDFTVELQTTARVAKVSATNEEKTGSVVLTKKDSDTGKVLAGAIFSLYNADGKKIKSGLTTNNDGQINQDGLKPGNYYFVETAAPKGYNFDKDKQYKFTVELQTKSKVATVSVTNTKIPVTPTNNKTNNKHHKHKGTHFLPDTAAKAVLFVSLLGSVLISVILVTSILNRKNKSND